MNNLKRLNENPYKEKNNIIEQLEKIYHGVIHKTNNQNIEFEIFLEKANRIIYVKFEHTEVEIAVLKHKIKFIWRDNYNVKLNIDMKSFCPYEKLITILNDKCHQREFNLFDLTNLKKILLILKEEFQKQQIIMHGV